MPRLISKPELFPQNDIKIEEFFGKISSGQSDFSLCRIHCEKGWSEPKQRPEFNEYMLVLSGSLCIRSKDGDVMFVRQGEAAQAIQGEEVQYSTPYEACDYLAICIPAFDLARAHRETF